MTDLSNVAAVPLAKPTLDWLALSKYAAGGFIVLSMLYLVISGKLPATDYEMLVVVPVLGALGIHQARQAGADITAKATIAAQTAPTPAPPPPAS